MRWSPPLTDEYFPIASFWRPPLTDEYCPIALFTLPPLTDDKTLLASLNSPPLTEQRVFFAMDATTASCYSFLSKNRSIVCWLSYGRTR